MEEQPIRETYGELQEGNAILWDSGGERGDGADELRGRLHDTQSERRHERDSFGYTLTEISPRISWELIPEETLAVHWNVPSVLLASDAVRFADIRPPALTEVGPSQSPSELDIPDGVQITEPVRLVTDTADGLVHRSSGVVLTPGESTTVA